jgi:S-adenosyl-L-methionine hydrolase (adenosine-forming)
MKSSPKGKGQNNPVITFSTDFGGDDPYVGVMKGVILGINPRAILVDLTHGLSHRRLLEAAFKLAAAADYFPKGTVHLAVVDPGVGSTRRPIVVQTNTHYWVGPDNGLFTRILQTAPEAKIFHLTNSRCFLKPVSATFHGRDVFAPAAAHLSRGLSLTTMGKRISDPVLLDLPEPLFQKNSLQGQGLYADRFGNLITNLGREVIGHCFQGKEITIRVGRRVIRGIKENYSQEKPGRLLALFGSNGFLEIACNLGSAAEMLGYCQGELLAVKLVGREDPR